MNKSRALLRLLSLPLVGFLGGAGISALSPGNFWMGWLAAGLLLFICVFLLQAAWRWAGRGRILAWMMVLAFVLRLFIGVGLSQALPVYGDDEVVQNAGYLFYDAYHRDQQAWQLAVSDQSLLAAFSQEYSMDQYGGLLIISAAIYRILSPDAMRPLLILILTAFAGAIGVPFFWKSINHRWGEGVAMASTWIFSLYPESILLGASQMREPFLLGLSAIAFWVVVGYEKNGKNIWRILAGLTSLGIMVVFSWRAALPIAVMLAVWFWVENLSENHFLRITGLIILLFSGIAVIFFSWKWLADAASWDALLTLRASGMVQNILEQLPESLHLPFITGYGLAQPVLPATIIETALPLRKGISIYRSIGWYALIPILIYGFFTVFKAQPRKDRRILFWTMGFCIVWILISSLRAGGDMWDNPRYRTMFLVWLALMAGWSWIWAQRHHDPWIWRWFVVEGIFLVFFTQWYLSRYFKVGSKLPFFVVTGVIVGVCLAFLLGCWIWDYYRKKG